MIPNILQDQIQPFSLADHMQLGGHCKVVVLFLVDPGIWIISTANVPCQQQEWWSEKIDMENGPFEKLPVELSGWSDGRFSDYTEGGEEVEVRFNGRKEGIY